MILGHGGSKDVLQNGSALLSTCFRAVVMVAKCIVDPRHAGPISRRGLCRACQAKKMREGGRKGGQNFRKSFHMAPSAQSKKRRCAEHKKVMKKCKKAWSINETVLQSMSIKAVKQKRPCVQLSGAKNRCCFRCGQRRDRCRSNGCVPYNYEVDKKACSMFLKHFDQFMYREDGIRTVTDCHDVQIVKAWGLAARRSYGLRTAVFGLSVIAHFKSIRTWGMINHCFRRQIDWRELKRSLIRCGHVWGNLTVKNPNHALYSGTCMSGSGLAPVGETYHDRFPHHFQLVLQSNSFDKVCKLLAEGIDSFEKFDSLAVSMQDFRKQRPGFLGGYHYKMFLDFLVACDWVPPKWVSEYPVCIKGGTAKSLDKIYPGYGHGAMQYSSMLNELTHRVMTCCHSWTSLDHQGSVGAALCWWHRLSENSSSAAHANRFAETGVVTSRANSSSETDTLNVDNESWCCLWVFLLSLGCFLLVFGFSFWLLASGFASAFGFPFWWVGLFSNLWCLFRFFSAFFQQKLFNESKASLGTLGGRAEAVV